MKRYSTEDHYGEYVRYEDVGALIQERDQLAAQVEQLQIALNTIFATPVSVLPDSPEREELQDIFDIASTTLAESSAASLAEHDAALLEKIAKDYARESQLGDAMAIELNRIAYRIRKENKK